MNRVTFLKRLTAAAIGIVVAKPIIDALPKPIQRSYIHGSTKFVITFDKPWRQYPLTFEDVMNTPYPVYHDKELL